MGSLGAESGGAVGQGGCVGRPRMHLSGERVHRSVTAAHFRADTFIWRAAQRATAAATTRGSRHFVGEAALPTAAALPIVRCLVGLFLSLLGFFWDLVGVLGSICFVGVFRFLVF